MGRLTEVGGHVAHLSSMKSDFETMLAGLGQSWKPVIPGSQRGIPRKVDPNHLRLS